MLRLFVTLLFVILLVSCGNLVSNAEKIIEVSQERSNEQLLKDRERDFRSLNEAYKKAAIKAGDRVKLEKINETFFSIISAKNYMDSLSVELKKLDEKDFKSIDVIEDIFINKGIGDTIFKKLKHSFDLIAGIAKSEKVKKAINDRCLNIIGEPNKESTNDVGSNKFLFFKMHSPQMEIWTLYGFESELVNGGIDGFADFD